MCGVYYDTSLPFEHYNGGCHHTEYEKRDNYDAHCLVGSDPMLVCIYAYEYVCSIQKNLVSGLKV
jgi:hypothetical protein